MRTYGSLYLILGNSLGILWNYLGILCGCMFGGSDLEILLILTVYCKNKQKQGFSVRINLVKIFLVL